MIEHMFFEQQLEPHSHLGLCERGSGEVVDDPVVAVVPLDSLLQADNLPLVIIT